MKGMIKKIEYNHSTRSIILDEVVKKDFLGQEQFEGWWCEVEGDIWTEWREGEAM